LECQESSTARRVCKDAEGIECNQCQHIGNCRHAVEDFQDSDLDYVYNLWLCVRTQMRYSFGGVAGLDYGAAIKTFETLGYEITPYDFMGLQTLEMDFLCEQAEKSEKKD